MKLIGFLLLLTAWYWTPSYPHRVGVQAGVQQTALIRRLLRGGKPFPWPLAGNSPPQYESGVGQGARSDLGHSSGGYEEGGGPGFSCGESSQGMRKVTLRRLTRSVRPVREPEIGLLVAEAATRLRCGASFEQAWQKTFERTDIADRYKTGVDSAGVPHGLRALQRSSSSTELMFAIPAAVAVCRLSHLTGAPSADVLEACAGGITEVSEAAAARRVALAGPRTSARMLALLPLLGLLLGYVLGSNPLAFLLSTNIGRVCLLVGFAFELAGIVWVRHLVKRAEEGS
ncbi:hypothetical protein [Actinobaculum sp. 313]|uniref:type II secretion system F family protein n=1 Tax=Actinobaculum sp. 313 TaxID=2495645 RepID=UPI000D5268FD|nr:hypothetical protein [Actinobaculum sp. 313]AWE41614.1 hypothetical protein DDD63_01250 [Actinobaculum sp. 313]